MLQALLASLAALLALVPLLTIAAHAVWNHAATWTAHILTTAVPTLLSTTALSALPAGAIALVLGGVPAWLTGRYQFQGRRFIALLALAPLLFSPYLLANLYFEITSNLAGSTPAHALLIGCCTSPYVFVLLRVALARLSPQLEEAARTLGSGAGHRIFALHIPLLLVPIVASLLLAWAETLSDYGAAARLGVRTYSVGMQDLWSGLQTGEVASFLSVLILAPLCLALIGLFFLVSKRSHTPSDPIFTQTNTLRPLTPIKGTAAALTGCLLATPSALAPLLVNGLWALERLQRGDLDALSPATLSSFLTSTTTTLVCLAIAVGLILLLPAAWRRIGTTRALWMTLLNYAAPSILLGFALLLISSDASPVGAAMTGIRDTRFWLVIGLTLKLLPLALFPVLDGLRRTPASLDDAARALGLTPFAARRRVVLPILAPAITAGAALVFIESSKELTLNFVLQPFGYQSLSLKVFALAGIQMTRDAAVWILAMQLLLLFPLWKLHQFIESE
jgi:iron(III) transport system permease protein